MNGIFSENFMYVGLCAFLIITLIEYIFFYMFATFERYVQLLSFFPKW